MPIRSPAVGRATNDSTTPQGGSVNPDVIADRIETYLRAEFQISPNDRGFNRTVDLVELGYIDSVGFTELLEFLSEEFGVEVPEDDLVSDEFLRIEGMALVVSRLAHHGVS
jgi:D-alanine--poly(phosphoribitol) ligase subunit 2